MREVGAEDGVGGGDDRGFGTDADANADDGGGVCDGDDDSRGDGDGVGGVIVVAESKEAEEGDGTGSCNSKWMPPGRRRESLKRSINANKGKWLRHARRVSSPALNVIIAILALA